RNWKSGTRMMVAPARLPSGPVLEGEQESCPPEPRPGARKTRRKVTRPVAMGRGARGNIGPGRWNGGGNQCNRGSASAAPTANPQKRFIADYRGVFDGCRYA